MMFIPQYTYMEVSVTGIRGEENYGPYIQEDYSRFYKKIKLILDEYTMNRVRFLVQYPNG